MPRTKAVIVFCYGVFDYSLRTDVEMGGLIHYGDGAADIINSEQPDEVVFCGGFTNPDSHESEARSFGNFVNKLVQVRTRTFYEEKSRNTPQNLGFALQLLERWGRPDEIVIVCDTYRAPKTRLLARRLCPKGMRWSVRPVKRKDIHPNSSWTRQIQQLLAYAVMPKSKLLA